MQDLPFNTRVLTRHNNLNFLRFIAAFSVIFSHSFTVSEGSDALGTPLDVITQNRLSIGGIAVAFFFLISGILIAKSCETHSSVRKFFKNRLLRIFPELIVCVLCSVFILGLCVTTYSFDVYVTSADTYRYLLNICLIPIHALPGVFENNPYPHVVNASLWAITAEFICYLFCFGLYKLTHFKHTYMRALNVIVVVFALLYYVFGSYTMLSFVRALLEFYIGIQIWVYRDKVPLDHRLCLAACLLCVLLILFGYDLAAMLLFFPYLTIWGGWGTKPIFEHFSQKHDYSYSIFLWGFPTEQLVAYLFVGIPWYGVALLSCVLSLVFAFISVQVISFVEQNIKSCILKKQLCS